MARLGPACQPTPEELNAKMQAAFGHKLEAEAEA